MAGLDHARGHADRRRARRRVEDEQFEQHELRIRALEIKVTGTFYGVAIAIAELGVVIFKLFTLH